MALTLSCGDSPSQCLALPCALPIAVSVRVVDAVSGQPVENAILLVSGPTTATLPCGSPCFVPGPAGTYALEVRAPGYVLYSTTVTVRGTTPACGCPTVERLEVIVMLSPDRPPPVAARAMVSA